MNKFKTQGDTWVGSYPLWRTGEVHDREEKWVVFHRNAPRRSFVMCLDQRVGINLEFS